MIKLEWVRVTKTSKEAALQKDLIKKDKDLEKKARFCPECRTRQFLRKRIVRREKFDIYLLGYSYKCRRCGCEWMLVCEGERKVW